MGPRYRDELEEGGEAPDEFDLPSPEPVEETELPAQERHQQGDGAGEVPPPVGGETDADVSW